jgi:hypothetical protein
MKNLLVHGVYLSVIAVLSFLLYDKTKTDDFVFMKSSEVLERDYKYINNVSKGVELGTKRNADSYPHKNIYLEISKKALLISKIFESKIDDFYKEGKMNENEVMNLRNEAKATSEKLLSLIDFRIDKTEIAHKNYLSQLSNDNQFWSNLKTMNNNLICNLNILKNHSLNDRVAIMEYCLDKSVPETVCGYSRYEVVINPFKTIFFEGEKIQAEIQLGSFSMSNNNITYEINNKKYDHKEGKVFFEEKNLSIGKHIIIAKAILKNPFTGNTTSSVGQLEYEVLPKCSRDCAKNQ